MCKQEHKILENADGFSVVSCQKAECNSILKLLRLPFHLWKQGMDFYRCILRRGF